MKKIVLSLVLAATLLAGGLYVWRAATGLNDGMHYARSEIHAATMNDRIYVAGGIGLFRVLDSCEYYTVADGRWSRCADLPRPLHHLAMAADGERVFASGGYTGLPFVQDADAALFALEPGGDAWREIAKLPEPLGQHAMVYRDGYLYLVGGQSGVRDIAAFRAYHLATGDWSEMPPMPTARHSHAAAIAGDMLYVTGGRSAEHGMQINVIEAFDFKRNTWRSLPAMPVGRAGHGAYIRNNRLHVIGGESLDRGVLLPGQDILDLSAMTWLAGSPLAKPRHGFAVGDGPRLDDIYIIGGGAHAGFGTIYSVSGTTQVAEQ